MKDLTYPYINSMIWTSSGLCLTNIVNQFVTLELQDGNSELLPRLHLKLLTLFTTEFLSWLNNANLNHWKRSQDCLMQSFMVHLSPKHRKSCYKTPITLTLDQCLSICRHYESLKFHLDTIKPKTVEYLQKRHSKSKGCGHGQGSSSHQLTPKPGKGRGNPGKSECSNCGKIHQGNVCPVRRSVCYGCNKRGHFKTMCHSSKRPSHPSTQQPKVVQEMQAQDQNTGKTKNVNIVEMIRSMGLHECQAKNPTKC